MNKTIFFFAVLIASVTFFTGCNKCDNVTCYNGGSCHRGNCTCPSDYAGVNCETYVGGGGNGSCIKHTNTIVRSINFFDTHPSSAYYNQVVANFRFTQQQNTYTGTNCPVEDCSVALSIQNSTAKKITFDYSISFNLNLVSWNYQGVVTINPYASVDLGAISPACASVNLGGFLIQSNNIIYQ